MDDASKALQNALAVNPDSPAALAASGEVELRQRHFKQAVTHLEAALDKIPSANRLHYSLAMAYRGMNDLERARSHFKQSGKVGVRPVDPVFDVVREVRVGARIYTLEGKTAFNAGRYDDAARLFVRAVGADESSAAALINLGTALEKLGDTQAAIERFQTALKIDPTEATALFNLGVLSAKTGNNSATAEHLTAYLKGHPDDIEARRELAKALSRLGRLPAAESQYRMLLAANPGDEDSLTALANNLAQQGRFNEIVNLLQSNLDQFPGRVRTTHALARVLVAAPDKTVRDGARALTLAQAAFKRQGTVAHGQTLAQAFAQVGRCDEAAELQSKLVSVAKRAAETDMATGLENDLTRYQSGPPCAVD